MGILDDIEQSLDPCARLGESLRERFSPADLCPSDRPV
jgi:hypothetical protein